MDKEHTAMERLRLASDMSLRLYKQPLMLTDSGGKDSNERYYYGYPVIAIAFAWLCWRCKIEIGVKKYWR